MILGSLALIHTERPGGTVALMLNRVNGMLANLQALRALAAIAVVVFHFGLLPPTSLSFTSGAAGVDLFFVLSGFIISYSSSRDARHFLARRFMRIVPPYWIATIVAALITLQNMAWRETADWLLQSLFYLPGPQGRPALIFVAWTLVYELAFYLLYWVALRAGRSRAPGVALILLLLVAFAPLANLPGPWPLFSEFAIGIGVYLITERFTPFHRLKSAAGLLTIGGGLALLPVLPSFTGYGSDDYQSLGRVLTWGIPAGFIVMGAVIAERSGIAFRNRVVLILGGASYAIYLLHPIAVGQLLQLPPNAQLASWAVCLGATILIVALSVGFHLVVEVPTLRMLRRFLGEHPQRGPAG